MREQPLLDIVHQQASDTDTLAAKLGETSFTIPKRSREVLPIPSNVSHPQQHAMPTLSGQHRVVSKTAINLTGTCSKTLTASSKSSSTTSSAPGTPPRSGGVPLLARSVVRQLERKNEAAELDSSLSDRKHNASQSDFRASYESLSLVPNSNTIATTLGDMNTQSDATPKAILTKTPALNVESGSMVPNSIHLKTGNSTAASISPHTNMISEKQPCAIGFNSHTNQEGKLESSDVQSITPQDLMAHLRAYNEKLKIGGDGSTSTQSDTPIPGASKAWSQPMHLLLIDLSTHSDFPNSSIKNSVHASFPTLLIKRFKRRVVSNFNLGNFLIDDNAVKIYEQWKQTAILNRSKAIRCVVIVYDDLMDTSDSESGAWALVKALADGMSADLINYAPLSETIVCPLACPAPTNISSSPATEISSEISVSVAYLSGGIRGFQEFPGAQRFLRSQQSGQPESNALQSEMSPSRNANTENMTQKGMTPKGMTPKRLSLSIGGDGMNSLYNSRSHLKSRPVVKSNDSVSSCISSEPSALSVSKLQISCSELGTPGIKRSRPMLVLDVPSPLKIGSKSSKSNLEGEISLQSPSATHFHYARGLSQKESTTHQQYPSQTPKSQLGRNMVEMDTSPVEISAEWESGNPTDAYSDAEGVMSREETPVTSPNDNAAPPEPYSRVTANILLGSDVIPLSETAIEQLSSLGVTHILNMAAEIQNSPIVVESGLFDIKWLPVLDNTEQDMDGPLMEAIEYISGAIDTNPKAVVFVHCKAGRSRSVSVVIGYLVAAQKLTLKAAYEMVRKVRKGVSPNLGFMAALVKVEKDVFEGNPPE
ncbi:hypothetical protein BASA60_002575 [Batrachochytrium salamandrivorans]|nr:hypothetical protein BASA60_002575 [Batrachochytrium salamandrivorans]KAH9250271.1 hypothetical protein BASA81_011952 [Batrachochytrium salamandrivorans]KAH9277120.1 hypothetical protein BASA83_000644 [Batrachochytrium salamandrivorans]